MASITPFQPKKIQLETFVRYVPLLLILLLFIIFSLTSTAFIKFRNLVEILQLSSIYLLLAAGETFPVLMGSIDLSIGGIIVASGVIAATIAPYGGIGTVVLILVIALLLGMLNGLIVAFLKLPSFIVTLATWFIYAGIAIALTEGYNINIRSNQFSNISNGRFIPGIPNLILWALLIYFLFVFLSEKTKMGRYIFAIGGKEDVAARMGINVGKYKIIAFSICGLLVGAGTLLLSSRLGMASARLGSSYLFNALIAVVLGGTALSGGVGGVRKTILGVLIITMMENGMNLSGVDIRVQYIVKAAILIAGVYVISIPDRSKQTIMK
ncbi:MAG: ABC transporter permease [Spirochaetales bacterium]|nr:ABC transporter permease [Spirochaetales bacterium]